MKNFALLFFIFFYLFFSDCNSKNNNYLLLNIKNNNNNIYYYDYLFKKNKNLNKFNVNEINNFFLNINHFRKINIKKKGKFFFIYLLYKPVLYKILLNGNNIINNNELIFFLKKFNININKFFNKKNFLKFKSFILKKYIFLGKYDVKINYFLSFYKKNMYLLKINIEEGNFIKINKIFFFGNKFFSKRKILSFINIKEYSLLNNFLGKNIFIINIFINDLNIIKSFYFKYGYFDFYIKSIRTKINNNKFLNIYIELNEGNRYKLFDIKTLNNIGIYNNSLNYIKKKIFFKKKFFDLNIINNIIFEIKKFLNNKGYIDVYIDKNIKKIFNKYIIIFLDIKFGKKFYVNNILFKGNKIFKNDFLKKKIPQKKNKLYNNYLVNLGKKNLLSTNLFNFVKIKKKCFYKDKKYLLNIIYEVSEINNSLINFNIGYGKKSNLNYNISLLNKNIFFPNSDFFIKGLRNKFVNNFDIFLSYPIYNFDFIYMKHKLFNNNLLDNEINNYDYLNINSGIKNDITFLISNFIKYKIGLIYSRNSLYNIKSQLSILKYFKSINKSFYLKSKKNKLINNDLLLTNNFIFNNLNNNVFPNTGFIFDIYNKITLPFSDNFFYKLYLTYLKYYSLNKNNKWIFFLKYNVGYINGFFGKNFPFYENFNYKNNIFLRGFDLDYVGYKKTFINSESYKCENKRKICNSNIYYNGNFISSLNLELIFPNDLFFNGFYSKYIRSSLFFDSGMFVDTYNRNLNFYKNLNFLKNINIFRFSTGVSLKILTPLGIVNFSFGIPFNIYNNDEINYIQFSLGNYF